MFNSASFTKHLQRITTFKRSGKQCFRFLFIIQSSNHLHLSILPVRKTSGGNQANSINPTKAHMANASMYSRGVRQEIQSFLFGSAFIFHMTTQPQNMLSQIKVSRRQLFQGGKVRGLMGHQIGPRPPCVFGFFDLMVLHLPMTCGQMNGCGQALVPWEGSVF